MELLDKVVTVILYALAFIGAASLLILQWGYRLTKKKEKRTKAVKYNPFGLVCEAQGCFSQDVKEYKRKDPENYDDEPIALCGRHCGSLKLYKTAQTHETRNN